MDTNQSSNQPVLFLKATVRQRVFIPTYTRSDGTVVQGHYANVHVAADHDHGRVASGQGTHSQRQAHARLSRHESFNRLPEDHRAHVVMEHATELQDKAPAASAVSGWRAAAMDGRNPTKSQWRAFLGQPRERQSAMLEQIAREGHTTRHLTPPDGSPLAWAPPAPKVVAAKETPSKSAPRIVGASASAKPASVDEALDHIKGARLASSNVNATVVNTKLDAIAGALRTHDPELLTMMSYGTNTYGKKAAKLANVALELLGSKERVSPGHKGTPGFRTDAQISAARDRAKAARTIDPSRDSLMTAIAKLGGVKKSEAMRQWGLGKNDVKGHRVGVLPVFSDRGLSLDRMGEALHELGYLRSDEHGRFDGRELEEHVSQGLAGQHHFTPEGYAEKAARDYEEQYQGLQDREVSASGFDELPDHAQQQIEEFLDENPDFTTDEIDGIERLQRLADEDVPFEPDAGTAGSGHGGAHQADAGEDTPF